MSTTDSNKSNGEVLEDVVDIKCDNESPIATALLGHFREYYNLNNREENSISEGRLND